MRVLILIFRTDVSRFMQLHRICRIPRLGMFTRKKIKIKQPTVIMSGHFFFLVRVLGT